MSRGNLSKVENGEVPYKQDLLEQLAELYNCTAGDLIMRDPTDKSAPWSILDSLRSVSAEERGQINRVIEALRRVS